MADRKHFRYSREKNQPGIVPWRKEGYNAEMLELYIAIEENGTLVSTFLGGEVLAKKNTGQNQKPAVKVRVWGYPQIYGLKQDGLYWIHRGPSRITCIPAEEN